MIYVIILILFILFYSFQLLLIKQKTGTWWSAAVLHTPDVIILSVEFVNILSMHEGLQPGLNG